MSMMGKLRLDLYTMSENSLIACDLEPSRMQLSPGLIQTIHRRRIRGNQQTEKWQQKTNTQLRRERFALGSSLKT